jgi:hypothetical protein
MRTWLITMGGIVLGMTVSFCRAADEPLTLRSIQETIRKARLSMPYYEADHSVYKVDDAGKERLFSTWHSGYASDGREYLRGQYSHIKNYSEWWSFNGKDLLSFCPEQKSGTIVNYVGRFNLHRPPKTMLGDWHENRYPMRFDQLLAVLREPQITTEELDGRPAIRVQGVGDINGKETLFRAWVDPDRGYLHLRSELCYPETGIAYAICQADRFEQIGEHWFPVEGRVWTYAVNPIMPEGVSLEDFNRWPQERTKDHLAKSTSWRRKPLDGESDHEKVVVTNVKLLPKVPAEVFDIEFPSGSEVYCESLEVTYTVGAAGSPELLDSALQTILTSDRASGAAIAEASRNKLLNTATRPSSYASNAGPQHTRVPNPASAHTHTTLKCTPAILVILACCGVIGGLWLRKRSRQKTWHNEVQP